jgi:hypothetical protein
VIEIYRLVMKILTLDSLQNVGGPSEVNRETGSSDRDLQIGYENVDPRQSTECRWSY